MGEARVLDIKDSLSQFETAYLQKPAFLGYGVNKQDSRICGKVGEGEGGGRSYIEILSLCIVIISYPNTAHFMRHMLN